MGKAEGGMNFSQPMLHFKTDHTQHNQHVGTDLNAFHRNSAFWISCPSNETLIYNEFWVLTPKEWDFPARMDYEKGIPSFHVFGWLLRGSFPHPSENANGQELLVAGTDPGTLDVVPSHW